MKRALTFIIPVRHQSNSSDWARLKRDLTDTVRSIASQDSSDWKAVIVANHGADLPNLCENFDVKWVDFPANELHERGSADKEAFYQAVRFDKGRRILAGMLHAGELNHVMVVDDDDFVSRKLTSFVAANPEKNGWYIRDGYVWSDGGTLLYRYRDFSQFCGSSLIIKADLYDLPESVDAASVDYLRRMLGSHVYIKGELRDKGIVLEPLPFTGAIYRVGHANAHSGSAGILSDFFMHSELLVRPKELAARLLRLRVVTSAVRHEFFGPVVE
jgi:hypothetical protein